MGETGSARDFDFWVGDWDVFGPEGRQIGRNTIDLLFGGVAIAEHWRGAGGVEGRSLNAYEASGHQWHQTWVDSSGDLLMLEGGLVEGAMVLSGTVMTDAGPALQRITWTPEDDGVRQQWESSTDQGVSWQTVFDGRYRPHGS
jgi:hypothetical protein